MKLKNLKDALSKHAHQLMRPLSQNNQTLTAKKYEPLQLTLIKLTKNQSSENIPR